jgi:hypothetical protein
MVKKKDENRKHKYVRRVKESGYKSNSIKEELRKFKIK